MALLLLSGARLPQLTALPPSAAHLPAPGPPGPATRPSLCPLQPVPCQACACPRTSARHLLPHFLPHFPLSLHRETSLSPHPDQLLAPLPASLLSGALALGGQGGCTACRRLAGGREGDGREGGGKPGHDLGPGLCPSISLLESWVPPSSAPRTDGRMDGWTPSALASEQSRGGHFPQSCPTSPSALSFLRDVGTSRDGDGWAPADAAGANEVYPPEARPSIRQKHSGRNDFSQRRRVITGAPSSPPPSVSGPACKQ